MSLCIRSLALSALVGIFLLPGIVSANTASWTSGILPDLAYYYWAWGNGPYGYFPGAQDPAIHNTDNVPLDTSSDHCVAQGDIGCGWAQGLVDAAVTVNYEARIFNDDTNVEITDGNSVEVGTRVRIEPVAYDTNDVSWVGTGGSFDSPYGRWVANAGPLALSCNAGDLITGGDPATYILLNMNPPTNGLLSSTNADCTGNVCTLNTPGLATFNFEFDDTYGKFYYRFETGGDCYAFNAPMREGNPYDASLWGGGPFCEGHNCVPGPDYQVDVPAQSISFSLNVTPPPAVPPGTPTLTGPITGYVGDTLQYTCTVPSSDTGTARCGFDLDSDSTADTYVPSGVPPFPAINTPQVFDFPAIAAGTYTISAVAEDDNYAQSVAWSTPITVTISERPCPIASFGLCNLPETASGSGYNQLCGGAVGRCNYSCNDGTWTAVENSCTPPTVTNLEICTLDLSSCANVGGTLVTDVNEPLSITWASVAADVCSVSEKPAHSDFTTGDDPDGTDNTGIFANPLPSIVDTYQISCSYNGGTPVYAETYVSTSAFLPVLSTSMTVVRSGSTVRLNWNTNNGDESLCTLAGAGVDTSDLTNGTTNGAPDAQTGYVDVVVHGRTTFTLTCPAGIALKTVEIIPVSWE